MTRWNRRMLFGALAVLVPALAGCEAGLNAPTQDFHPAAFGAYANQNGISISNAFVLGPSLNGPAVAGGRAGVFFAISSQDGDRLVSISAPIRERSGRILAALNVSGQANRTSPQQMVKRFLPPLRAAADRLSELMRRRS